MAIILIEASSSSAAEEIVTTSETGELWGIDLGTTTKASSYSKYVLLELTTTRSFNLANAAPEDEVTIELQENDPPSFTDSTSESKSWYLRGKL